AGFGEGARQERRQVRQVRAGGDLRHHAPVELVRGELRRDEGREDAPVAVEERDGGLVAGGLDPEDERRRHDAQRARAVAWGGVETPFSVTIASTRAAGVTSNAG